MPAEQVGIHDYPQNLWVTLLITMLLTWQVLDLMEE